MIFGLLGSCLFRVAPFSVPRPRKFAFFFFFAFTFSFAFCLCLLPLPFALLCLQVFARVCFDFSPRASDFFAAISRRGEHNDLVSTYVAVQVRYVRFFRYFFANNVFVIALLALALLSAIYLVRR